jgi:AmmeMemoRadiSam system protein B
MSTRSPAVAGMFYPAHPDRLRKDVSRMLREHPVDGGAAAPKALIVPHAGYVYSGGVAAAAYRQLEPARATVRRVVLLGPAHRVYLRGVAVPECETFSTPMGTVPVDRQAVEAISGLPGVVRSDSAHAEEHSLEVQLPFLQSILGAFSLVPIVVGQCEPEIPAAVLDELWGGPETLIIVSSDLSHYLPYEQARETDGRTCRRILEKSSALDGHDACGAHAINGLMASRHGRDLSVTVCDLRNSGDTAGDRSRVVGYGAFALH